MEYGLKIELNEAMEASRSTSGYKADTINRCLHLRSVVSVLAETQRGDAREVLERALERTQLWDLNTADEIRIREAMCVLRCYVQAWRKGSELFVGA